MSSLGFKSDVASALQSSKVVYVATMSADLVLSSPGPTWFMFDDEQIYFEALQRRSIVNDVAKGSPVHFWVGSTEGPHHVGQAELKHDPQLARRMADAYVAKYWLARWGFGKPSPERVRSGVRFGKTVIVKVYARYHSIEQLQESWRKGYWA